MSDDNILPFKRRSDSLPTVHVVNREPQHDYQPHKGQDLPGHPLGWPYGATVDLGKHGKFVAAEPIDLSDALRESWGLPKLENTGTIEIRRPPKPSWSARYGFAATVMAVVAVFAYICATVWAGPWPGDWGRADWIFVGVCLLIGAGYIAAQERRR
jgi:hypothetical protein